MRIFYRCGKLFVPLWVPNPLIKSKRIQKAIHIEKYSEFIEVALLECKKYTKKNGRFTIIDVKTEDEGKAIFIKIMI